MFFHCYSREQWLLILLNHRGLQKLNDVRKLLAGILTTTHLTDVYINGLLNVHCEILTHTSMGPKRFRSSKKLFLKQNPLFVSGKQKNTTTTTNTKWHTQK